jgi:hypothetical protein
MGANVRELGVVKVAKPCHRDWEQMSGDARVRFCADCKLHVYDLSSMTTDEAHQLIREKEGQLCVRFFTRADGTVLTRDCPVGVRAHRLKLVAAGATAAVVSLSGLAFAVTQAFSDSPSEPCSAQPVKKPTQFDPKAAAAQADPDDASWIEKRRKQLLGPRETEERRHPVIGKMMIRHQD